MNVPVLLFFTLVSDCIGVKHFLWYSAQQFLGPLVARLQHGELCALFSTLAAFGGQLVLERRVFLGAASLHGK